VTSPVRVQLRGPRYNPHPSASTVESGRLVADLADVVSGEVRFDAGSRALYSTDSSNFRQLPIGVVIPRDVEDVVRAVEVCRRHGAPITCRGGGTSLAGETTNVAVVIDFSKYLDRVLEINARERWARVQPGCVLDTLRDAAADHDLTFGPDPATHDRNTLGGMIGNNSCGTHSPMAGKTSDNVLELDILLYDGTRLTVRSNEEARIAERLRGGGREAEIYRRLLELRHRYEGLVRDRFPDIPRRVSGYALDCLLPERGFNLAAALTGTEGTCAIVLEAKVRLVHSPPARSLLVLGYSSLDVAADHVPALMRHRPLALEAFDHVLLEDMHDKHLRPDVSLLPDGDAFLLLEFGGDCKEESDAHARDVMAALEGLGDPATSLFDDPVQEQRLWAVRESALGATGRVPGKPDAWPGWEDAGLPVDRVGDYLREFNALLHGYDYTAAIYGHFSQGCIHCRITFDLETEPGIARYRAFLGDAADLVIRFGGSLSGEHGDGQQRGPLLEKMYGAELVEAFREFKAIWDPDDRMNPGKVVDPVRAFAVDENLRLGARFRPWQPDTHFRFPDDDGSFDRAVLRCVGVGLCRRDSGGIMCPSFMATNEEEHSTRGRARLLFEMLDGEAVTGGWRSPDVADALDLCLSCKGCKHDCPVNVDMATYKAEFLSHHHSRRLRPRQAYSLGLIMVTARAAARTPLLANAALAAPGLGALLKRLAGVTPHRPVPRFARQTLQKWARSRPRSSATSPRDRVIVYPDTFTNFFEPAQGIAAVELLEAAGFDVVVPDAALCCGRPLYDYGMLPTAKRLLRRNLSILEPELTAGTPIIVLEPSCAAVFRDELRGLFPHDVDAQRLGQQTTTLTEFLAQRAPDAIPAVDSDLLVWHHCHQRAVLDTRSDTKVLDETGASWSAAGGTCCGLAGSWGFEQAKYDLSMQIGEQSVFPAVRAAADTTVVVADGFSCRNQIRHGTGRRAVHIAQVLRDAQQAQGPERPAERS
jgi:FAD/FMN-containing dehydrogenase/Fe-S oxidoreductase